MPRPAARRRWTCWSPDLPTPRPLHPPPRHPHITLSRRETPVRSSTHQRFPSARCVRGRETPVRSPRHRRFPSARCVPGKRLSPTAQSCLRRCRPPIVGSATFRMPLTSEHGRMRHRTALPPQLGATFAVSSAAAAGVTRWRRDTPDLHRPFCGVRSTAVPETLLARLECYQPRMKPGHRFVGRTALRLWGLPHPTKWAVDEKVDVAVPLDGTPPRTRGVRGRRLSSHLAGTFTVGRLRVVDPLAAVFSCADDLSFDDAVVVLDALLTRSDSYPGLRPGRPVFTVEEIEDRLSL